MQVRARWRAVELTINVPASVPGIRGTADDMGYLLSNLIGNAIKYTDAGGRVVVSLQGTDDEVIGSVSDTGIGIPEDDIPRIFDEFYRSQHARDRDAQGSGLGLAIVKRVVEAYGGHIHVESALGEGSTFTFAFPRVEATERGR
jgi:two-component system phosphate regulon sensor histidine kinase PhoR